MVHTTTAAVSQSRSAGRVPPHNAEAEESLLGAMLLSKDAIATAVETVAADDFYKPAHAHLFEAIVTLYGAGEPVDPITVAEFLHRAGVLDGLGGKQAVLRIQAATPAASNAGFYARIVADHALLRRLVAVGTEIAELGYTLPEDVTAVLDRAESLVFDVANRRQTTSLRGIHATLQDSLTHLESLFEHDGQATGLPSGFRDLDEVLLGWQPSNLIVVAARPGQGKTAFALGAATHAAVHQHRPVIFFSLEMGYLELTQRILAAEAGINSRLLRTGRIPETDWTKISKTVGRLAEAPLYIDDNPHLTVMDMRAKCRRLKAQHGDLGLVVVDYLQLMSTPKKAENRQVEVSELSRGLKVLARDLDVPVLALSQLNRSLEYRADKRPMLADLRESGALEPGRRRRRLHLPGRRLPPPTRRRRASPKSSWPSTATDRLLEVTAGRPGDQEVVFHAGLRFDLARLVCVALGEHLIHGYDMATAVGRPWPIDPAHALLVLLGYGPVYGLCVNPKTTAGLTAAYGIELRGADPFTVRFIDGEYGVEGSDCGPVDCVIAADPVAFLLVGTGRLSRWAAIALGLLTVSGTKPELGLGFSDLFSYP